MSESRVLRKEEFIRDADVGLAVMRITDHHVSDTHAHDFGELVMITHGKGVHCVGGQRYRISAGDVFVILGNTHHGYEEPQSLGLINLLFDWERLALPKMDIGTLPGYQALFQVEPHFRGRSDFKNHLRLNQVQLEELLVMVSSLERELKMKAGGYQFASMAWLSSIIIFLSRAYGAPRGGGTQSVVGLSRVLSCLEENLDATHQVADLAELAGMSESTLFREFEKVVGRSPIEHLLHLRIERAKRLLGEAESRVSEVAERVGFGDSNYFSRQFRAVVGMTPREWQRIARLRLSPAAESSQDK